LSNCFCPGKVPISPPCQQASIYNEIATNKSLFGGLLFVALVKGPIVGSER
jgi:hypothetical protein